MNRKLRFYRVIVAIVLTSVTSGFVARADEVAEKAREVFKRHQKAVVTVQIVLKATYTSSGRTSPASESKRDITGTVVDPSGLTVLSLSECDPAEMYQMMMNESATR